MYTHFACRVWIPEQLSLCFVRRISAYFFLALVFDEIKASRRSERLPSQIPVRLNGVADRHPESSKHYHNDSVTVSARLQAHTPKDT